MHDHPNTIPRRGSLLRRALLPTLAALFLIPSAAIASERFTYSLHWGGFGHVAHRHTENLCENLRVEPGASRGVGISVHEVETPQIGGKDVLVAPPGHGHDVSGTLVCSPMLEVWAHTSGPWDPNAPGGPGWLSIRCPYGRPLLGGAGYWTDPDRALSQISGGFGTAHDGYWHYRFHNSSEENVTIQFWGVCFSHRFS